VFFARRDHRSYLTLDRWDVSSAFLGTARGLLSTAACLPVPSPLPPSRSHIDDIMGSTAIVRAVWSREKIQIRRLALFAGRAKGGT
jgi:hypothetical protein